MQLPYKTYGVLTAGELRNKLKGVSNDTPVYVVVDKSDDNFDENGILKVVHPIESVERELTQDCSGMDDEPERNLILHLPEDFYYTYECRLKTKTGI